MTDPSASTPPPGSQKNQLAQASMICGIVSLPMLGCCGALSLPLGLIGIVAGGLSLSNIHKDPSLDGRTEAIVGIGTGAVGVLAFSTLMLIYGGIVGLAVLERM